MLPRCGRCTPVDFARRTPHEGRVMVIAARSGVVPIVSAASAADAVLKHLGWEIEKSERTIGSTIAIERSLFTRDRILWMDKDQPIEAKDRDVETRLLADSEKSTR